MFYILTAVLVAQLYTFDIIYQTVYLKSQYDFSKSLVGFTNN